MVKARVEQTVLTEGKVEVHVVVDRPEGQYRGRLEFDHEPDDKELERAAREWAKTIKYVRGMEVDVEVPEG